MSERTHFDAWSLSCRPSSAKLHAENHGNSAPRVARGRARITIDGMSSTLQQVAALAEVSVSTASRALNRHPAITAETVSRVRRAAEQLCYRPRRSHRRPDPSRLLARANIGLVCLGMDRSLVELPAVASAISGAEAALSKAGATVLLAQVPDLEKAPRALLRKRLDGVVLAGAMQGTLIAEARSEVLDWLRTLATVWILGRPSGCWGDAIASDDYATGGKAAEYLFAHGHRQLAFLNPKPDHLLFMRREDGFVARAGNPVTIVKRADGRSIRCVDDRDVLFAECHRSVE